MAVIGIRQVMALQTTFLQFTSSTLTDVPGMSFEMLPGKMYAVEITMSINYLAAAGCQLRWENVKTPANVLSFLDIHDNTNGSIFFGPAVNTSFTPGSNAQGKCQWTGVFESLSTTEKKICQLKVAPLVNGQSLFMVTGVGAAILIN